MFEVGAECTASCCFDEPNGPFTNRVLNVVDGQPQQVNVGWNSCGAECTPSPGADVEFCVDIGCIMPDGPVNVFGTFEPFGGFLFFNPTATPMMDPDGDGVYCATVFLPPGDVEFKFLIDFGLPTFMEESFEVDAECTVSCCFGEPNGPFTNRIHTVVDGNDESLSFVFNVPCEDTYEEPVVNFPQLDPVCGDGGVATIVGGATPAGGEYTGVGVSDNGDGTFDLDLDAVVGDATVVTYTFVDDLECEDSATSTLEVIRPLFTCISELNVTLDEACGATLTPSMVLRGSDCVDAFNFEITVMDENPDNGPIIDGCGRYQYKIENAGGHNGVELDFTTCWGYVNAEDKTAPNEVSTPDDAELPCVDFEEIMLTMLPSDINRCWIVERVTDKDSDNYGRFLTVPGTMAPALKDRLDLIAGDVSSSDPNFSAGPAIVAEFSDGCAPRLQVCVNDVADLVSIRRVILGLDAELNNTGATWRFVSTDYNLTAGNWSAAFPEVYNVNNLQGNLREGDFVAMQLGNVVRAGGRAALDLNVQDAELAAGQTHTVELTSGELAGFQGTLELAAGLELVNVSYEGEGALNLNRAGEGLVAMAFNGAATLAVEVRATEAVRLSDAVSLTDAITLREGVAANGTAGSLNLNFAGLVPIAIGTELVNALEQNMPNPVAETTRIAYTLATAGQVTLNIQDIQGRTVLVRELEGFAGRNVIELNVSELGGAAGVLSYTVISGDFTATKKMVVVQ